MNKLIQYCTKASLYDGAFDSVVGWQAAGMGYIITTDSGSLIVVDGGNTEDAQELIALLEKYSDGNKPLIEKWIISHPHGDHYFALREICSRPELYERISVKELIYSFPADFKNSNGALLCSNAIDDMKRIASVLGASIKTPQYDELIVCDGLELHFIYTPDDLSIFKGQQNPNVCSLIFTVKSRAKKIMFTGDAFRRSLQMTVWRFGKELKCDILQMPHHGLCDTGLLSFYKAVNAESVLIPISKAGYRTMHSDMYGDDPKDNLWAEENAKTVYKAFDGTVEIEI